MSELLVLDPSEVADAERVEFDITELVGGEGPDYGQAEIDLYRAQAERGEVPVDFRIPNRVVTIPLNLRATADLTFDEVRTRVQAYAARFQQEGGWLKRSCAIGDVFADVVSATLKMGGSTAQAVQQVDQECVLTLECLPDWYGDEVALTSWSETTASALVGVEDGPHAGDYPGRVRIVVTEADGETRLGMIGALRSRCYDDAATAAIMYEAEALTPLDAATIATLSGASGGAAFNTIQHASLRTDWTAVLSTDILPAVRSVGVAASGIGAISPGLPAGVESNDILVMFIETANEAVSVPSGWAHVTGSPVSGTATRLTVLWKRAGSSESAPSIADPGDHCVAQIVAVSGCIESGNPWDVTQTSTEATSDTSVSITGATTTVDGCLVLAAVATGADVASTAHISSFANADLQAVTERIDNWASDGNGGGIGVASGVKVKAGAFGATTATVGTAFEKAMMAIALKPNTGGNKLTHRGTYRVWARCYSTSTTPPDVRFVWGAGGIVNPGENERVAIPGPSNFYWLNLGEIRVDQALAGTHQWAGRIEAIGASGGENVSIDEVHFVPVDDWYGLLRAPQNVPTVTSYSGQDQFTGTTSGNALGTRAAPSGGSWATSGDATDFAFTDAIGTLSAEALTRTVASTTNGRFAILGTTDYAAVNVECVVNVEPDSGSGDITGGVIARWTNSTNHLRAVIYFDTDKVAHLEIHEMLGGVKTVIASDSNASLGFFEYRSLWRVRLIVTPAGYAKATVTALGVATGSGGGATPAGTVILEAAASRSSLATGGTLATGEPGIFDLAPNGARFYDDFRVATLPDLDATLYPNQSAELRTDGIVREDSAGVSFAAASAPIGSLPRWPTSGLEARPTEIYINASRGDFDEIPDTGIDDINVQAHYRPCWLYVPDGRPGS